mgnify:CR=1 FL=1
MNLLNYWQFLEPMQDQFTRIYSAMSGIIAVILVLWVLNLIAGLIQRTFAIGKSLGSFYRRYLHSYLKTIAVKFFSMVRNNGIESTVQASNKV